jgi:hypothetical protein
LLLEIIVLGVAATIDDIKGVCARTLLAVQAPWTVVAAAAAAALRSLQRRSMIYYDDACAGNGVSANGGDGSSADGVGGGGGFGGGGGGRWLASPLGRAVVMAGVEPRRAAAVAKALVCARRSLCLETGLHPLFLVTPIPHRRGRDPAWGEL